MVAEALWGHWIVGKHVVVAVVAPRQPTDDPVPGRFAYWMSTPAAPTIPWKSGRPAQVGSQAGKWAWSCVIPASIGVVDGNKKGGLALSALAGGPGRPWSLEGILTRCDAASRQSIGHHF